MSIRNLDKIFRPQRVAVIGASDTPTSVGYTVLRNLVGSGFRLAHGGGSVERPPAMPGEHAEEILGEAGYAKDEIAALRRDRGPKRPSRKP